MLSLGWMAPRWDWIYRVPTRMPMDPGVLDKAPSPAPSLHCPAPWPGGVLLCKAPQKASWMGPVCLVLAPVCGEGLVAPF